MRVRVRVSVGVGVEFMEVKKEERHIAHAKEEVCSTYFIYLRPPSLRSFSHD